MKNYNITRFKEALTALTPQERLYIAQFMDFDGYHEDGMNSLDVYDALEKADVSDTGEPQEMLLHVGLSLPGVRIKVFFEKVEEIDKNYTTTRYEVMGDR